MKRVTNGMHLANQGQWHIEQMLRAARTNGAVTLLHFMMFPHDVISDNTGDIENAYWYGKLRYGWPAQGIPAAPERLIHVRLYQSNWADWDPVEVARRCVPLLSGWRDYLGRSADLWMDPFLCVSPCNEQNLEGPESARHDYVRHARWQLDFWDEVDRLKPDRRALSCLGAWAYGGDVKPDVPDSEYQVPEVRELCQRVDILATHPYAHLDWGNWDSADPQKDGYWHLLRDFRPAGWRDSRQPGRPHDIGGILAQIPGKPLLISEAGTFVHGDVGRNAETIAAMRLLLAAAANSGRVLGVTWFIWNSGPEHAGNRIWHNEALRNAIEAFPDYDTTATVPTRGQAPPVTPPPEPPVEVPTVPAGTVRPAIEVLKGDGWWAIARRAYGTATAANVSQLQAANAGVVKLTPGMRLWVPGYRAVPE